MQTVVDIPVCRCRTIHLAQEVIDVAADAISVHRFEDGLHSLGFRQFVEFLTAMNTGELKNQCESEPGVLLDK